MDRHLSKAPRRSARSRVAPALAALTLATMLGMATGARAQVSDKAAAEALFDEGKRLLEAGNPREACPKFEASHKRDPGIGTLLFLGECLERTGRFAGAWAAFREAASMAKQAGDPRERVARDRADALNARLFRVSVVADKPVKGLKVSVDGRVLAPEELGVALPLDAGPHEVVAEAPGFVTVRKSFEVPATDGGSATWTLPELVADGSTPLAPTATPTTTAAPTSAPPGSTPTREPPGKGLLISGIVVGSVGVASLVVTGVLAGIAVGKDGDADDICSDTACRSQRGADLSSEARTLGNVATGTFIGGLVLAGAGLTLMLLQPSDDTSRGAAPGPAAALRVGPAGLGLEGSF